MIDQKSREYFYFTLPVFVVDSTLHCGALWLLMRLLPAETYAGILPVDTPQLVYLLLVLAFIIALQIIPMRLHQRKVVSMQVFWRAILQTVITYANFALFVTMVFKVVPRRLLIHELIITAPVIIAWHYLALRLVRYARSMGHNTRHVVIVGADETAKRLYDQMQHGQAITGYRVQGFFSSLKDLELPEGAQLLGPAHKVLDYLDENRPDEIYCSVPPASDKAFVDALVHKCNEKLIDFFYVPTMDGYPHRQMSISQFGRVTTIMLRQEPMNSLQAKLFKRAVDIIISALFLVTVYPWVWLFVAIGTRISSPGPIYFRQERTGYNGHSFRIYKFRSMRVNADADKLQATEDDPRKTKFGDFLRRTSIDELPQFINVLKGDMSLIGPRPHMEYHTEVYKELVDDYMIRHLSKPGITGWAQVNGCRGETRSVEEMKNRVEHDIWYIENWTPLLDLEIILKTIVQLLPGRDKQAY